MLAKKSWHNRRANTNVICICSLLFEIAKHTIVVKVGFYSVSCVQFQNESTISVFQKFFFHFFFNKFSKIISAFDRHRNTHLYVNRFTFYMCCVCVCVNKCSMWCVCVCVYIPVYIELEKSFFCKIFFSFFWICFSAFLHFLQTESNGLLLIKLQLHKQIFYSNETFWKVLTEWASSYIFHFSFIRSFLLFFFSRIHVMSLIYFRLFSLSKNK